MKFLTVKPFLLPIRTHFGPKHLPRGPIFKYPSLSLLFIVLDIIHRLIDRVVTLTEHYPKGRGFDFWHFNNFKGRLGLEWCAVSLVRRTG